MSDKKAKSFVAIMVAIALLALFLRIAIERVIDITASSNESQASQTLKLISAALENYAKDHMGLYPSNIFELIQSKPAYLDKNYLDISPYKGYIYDCSRIEEVGYSCSASPSKCGLTGKASFSVATGGVFVSEQCQGKD